jgi:hypothetical protein
MKKIIIICIICILPLFMWADVAPSGEHPVDNCVRITNLDDYQEIAMLGFIVGPTYDSPHFLR